MYIQFNFKNLTDENKKALCDLLDVLTQITETNINYDEYLDIEYYDCKNFTLAIANARELKNFYNKYVY